MNNLKIIGLILVALILGTLVSLPSALVFSQEEKSYEYRYTSRWWTNISISFDEALELAYMVRNETYPMFQWTMSNNVTLSEKMLARGDYFLELAINTSETNETQAKAYALIATVIYSHAPVTAYILLGKTIKNNLGENNTVTNETVQAVLEKTNELKDLVDEVVSIAEGYNVTIPDRVNLLKTIAKGYINISQRLLTQGYVKAALRFAVKAYHKLVVAYSITVKATIAQKLRLGEPENLTLRLGLVKVSREVLKRLVEHLPETIKERIINIIKERHIRTPEEFKHIIKDIMKEYYRLRSTIMIKRVAFIATRVVMYAATLPTETGQAVRIWLMQKGFIGPGMGKIRFWKLYKYIENVTARVYQETNATGLVLINETLTELSIEIQQTTGIQVDLPTIFYMQMTIHVHIHHEHRG